MNIMTLGPGGGKTTSAMQLARELLENNVRVTYLTITNTAIDDVTRRFQSLHSKELTEEQMGNFKPTTMHTFAISLIRKRNPQIRLVPSIEYKQIPFDVINDASTHEQFVEHIKGMTEEVTIDGKVVRELVLPLDWAVAVLIAFKIRPDDSDILIIDEYQDMNTNEIYALASIFEDNAYLYGDLNQTIYQFRFPEGKSTVTSSSIAQAPSYRFNQESCEFLNRYILMKDAMLPDGTTNLTMLYEPGYDKLTSEQKDEREPSIHLVKFTDAVKEKEYGKKFSFFTPNNSKRELPEYFVDKINTQQGTEQFAVISATNTIAVEYSKLIRNKFGKTSLQVWYEPVYYHPLYKLIRDALTGPNGVNNFNSIATKITFTLNKLGYQCNLNNTRSTFEVIVNRRANDVPKQLVSLNYVLKVLDAISKDELPSSMFLSKEASMKSNKSAALTVLSMLSIRGLRSAFAGLRLQSEENRPGRVLTIHSAKGIEADYVFLDISQQGRSPKTHNDYIQQLNMLYVAMSRHRKSLYITVEPWQSDDFFNKDSPTAEILETMSGLMDLGSRIAEQEDFQMQIQTDVNNTHGLNFSKIVSTILLYAQHKELFSSQIEPLLNKT